MEFGILIQPFDDLNHKSSLPSIDEYRIAMAKVHAGETEWRKSIKEFTTFSGDIKFHSEYRKIANVPENLRNKLNRFIDQFDFNKDPEFAHSRLKEIYNKAKNEFFNFLEKVPFKWEPIIFEANTPFTSYLRIKESISLIRYRFHYFDRYLKELKCRVTSRWGFHFSMKS